MDSFEYVQRVLDAYRVTPGTCGVARRADRAFALELFERGVAVEAVENALVLAAARRMLRSPDSQPLNTIRSLAYFSPVINEVLSLPVDPAYFQHLRIRLARSRQR